MDVFFDPAACAQRQAAGETCWCTIGNRFNVSLPPMDAHGLLDDLEVQVERAFVLVERLVVRQRGGRQAGEPVGRFRQALAQRALGYGRRSVGAALLPRPDRADRQSAPRGDPRRDRGLRVPVPPAREAGQAAAAGAQAALGVGGGAHPGRARRDRGGQAAGPAGSGAAQGPATPDRGDDPASGLKGERWRPLAPSAAAALCRPFPSPTGFW